MKMNRFKHRTTLLTLILTIVFLTACTSESPVSTTTTTSEMAPTTTITEQSEPQALSMDDLSVEADGNVHIVLGDAGNLIGFLGEPTVYSAAPSCLFEGEDKLFEFADLIIYTIPDEDTDLIDGIDLLTDRFQTRRGITVGMTRDEVLAAYGEPFDQEYDLIYVTDLEMGGTAPRITFVMDGDTVSAISIYSGSNAAS